MLFTISVNQLLTLIEYMYCAAVRRNNNEIIIYCICLSSVLLDHGAATAQFDIVSVNGDPLLPRCVVCV